MKIGERIDDNTITGWLETPCGDFIRASDIVRVRARGAIVYLDTEHQSFKYDSWKGPAQRCEAEEWAKAVAEKVTRAIAPWA